MDTDRLKRSAGVPPAPDLADRKHAQRSAGVPPAPGFEFRNRCERSGYVPPAFPAPDLDHPVKGWHSRGYLPHFDGGAIPQSVTFRLCDSLPADRIRMWKDELRGLRVEEGAKQYRERIEEYLDLGTGAAWLKDHRVASLIEEALLHFDAHRYELYAWVVMPNHVHTLFAPRAEWTLSAILYSWKSFTSKAANRLLKRTGAFWQEDYFDRFVRHDQQFWAAVHYIEENPVKAGLVSLAADWPFSSARLRANAGVER